MDDFFKKRRKALGLDSNDSTDGSSSFFEQRKKALGIASGTDSGASSFFESRKMELGLIPDTRPHQPTPQEQMAQQYGGSFPTFDANQSPVMRAASGHPQLPNLANVQPPHDEPSFLERLGESLSPAKAWEGIKGLASHAVSNPVNVAKDAMQKVGEGADYFEEATGLDHLRGLAQGGLSANLKPDIQTDDNSYWGQYKNLFDNAGQALRSVAGGAVSGFQNPEETRQQFEGKLNQATANMDPVARFGLSAEAGAGTDPLTFLPLDAALTGASKGARALGEMTGLKSAAKGVTGAAEKAAPETSLFAKERAQILNPEVAVSSPPNHALEPSVPIEAPAMKQNLLTDLFGDQGIGISAVADPRRISKNPLTTVDQIVGTPIKKDIKGVKANVAATAKAVYQDFLDDLDPLKLFSKLEKERTGSNLPLSKDPYESAIASRRANNIANVIVKEKFVTPEGQVLGEGLENTFKKVPRGKDREFLDYLVLRHAETRMARGEQVYDRSLNMTPEKVRADIERKEKLYPGFVNIAKEYDQFTDNMIKTYGVKEGIISPEAYQAMREQNPTYVPMRRQFSMSEKFANNKNYGVKPAFSGQKAPIKEVSPTGSPRRIVDPRRSLIEQTGAWVNSAMRNRVMQNIHELVQRDPEAWRGIAEIVPENEVASASSMKQINKVLEEDGVEGLLESLNKDFELAFRKSGNQGLKDDNIVRVMVGGKPVHLRVQNPEAVKALIGLGPEQSNFVMDMFDAMSRATKFGATGALAPIFAVKSLSMDAIQSMIQSEKPVHQLWNMGHAILSQFADMLPKNTPVPVIESLRKLAQEYKLAGGEYSAALKGDRQLNKNISAMKRPPILSPQGVAKGVKGGIALPFKAMHKLSDVAENAPRMGAFKTVMKDAGGEKSRENVTKALRASQEVTTNFSRRGAQSRNIEKFIPYSNAAMQSLYRFTVSWKKNPIRTAAMVGGAVMLPKAIEYMQFHDDPDYQNLPAREKYRNLIVRKNNDGTFVKVPMPPEYNALGAFMVDSLEWLNDDVPHAFKGAKDAIANIYTPPVVSGALQPLTQGGGAEEALSGVMNSTVLSPITSVLSNRDYAGRPIESMALSDRSPQNRYDERTSGPAIWLGEKLNMSPKKVDYLIRSYGGDPARLILPLTSQVGEGNTRNTLLKNFIVDPTFTNNMTNDFYQAKTLLNQAYRDNKEVGKPLPSWYDDNLRQEISSTAKGSLSSRISDLTGQKKALTENSLLSNEQKTARLRDIQSQINKLYMDINSKLVEKDVPIANR